MIDLKSKFLRERLLSLPSDAESDASYANSCDNFYKLPDYVQCFIERANQELPDGWVVKPWTLNVAVTVFHEGYKFKVIPYESLEAHGLVKMLDYLGAIAANFRGGTQK